MYTPKTKSIPKSYGLDYKLEQNPLNPEIDKALEDYYSKSGGDGGNRPDVKLLLEDKNAKRYPVIIEYKGVKNRLVKLDSNGNVANTTAKVEPNYKHIKDYAVNGAVHYANAILHHTTSFTDIISIGMTGYEDEAGKIKYQIGVYFVSKNNYGVGQKIEGSDKDFSFLKKENFDGFIEHIKSSSLTEEEIKELKNQKEREIDISLKKLNNDIYENEKGLGENDRVYLVAATIIATIGIPNKVPVLEKDELKSQTYVGGRDGDIVLNRIKAFLTGKKIPDDKKDLIVRTLENTLTTENINKRDSKKESQLKRVFRKIVDDIGIYYKIGLTTDFTGKLFNEMYGWLGFSQDKLNDVVLTPAYVATLLVKLARVDKDSYVWDFATGSAGLLVAAMNEMLEDAKSIATDDERIQKEMKIKSEQLFGLELLSSVYMLAILNMIMIGDGSSNILNKDSLLDFGEKF